MGTRSDTGTSSKTRGRPSRAERRVQLLDDAVAAIREYGPAVSMEQLASSGGVTKPILYRHFGDRDGLVRALAERFSGEVVQRLMATLRSDEPTDLLRAAVDAYLLFLEEDPSLYRFLTQSPVGGALAEANAVMDLIARPVAQIIGDQLRSAGLDAGGADPYAFGIVGMVHQAGDWWLRTGTMSRASLVDYLSDLLWLGFAGIAAQAEAGPS